MLEYAMDLTWKMIGNEQRQSNFETDKSQKKIDINRFKSVLIPLKLKTKSDWKKCI